MTHAWTLPFAGHRNAGQGAALATLPNFRIIRCMEVYSAARATGSISVFTTISASLLA